jgi:hypothetical protein
MLCGGLENRMAGTDQVAQIAQQVFQVRLHGLKQFCNRFHGIARVARS